MPEPSDAEVVAAFRRWAYRLANDMTCTRRHLCDDLAQEGLIEAWRILQVKGGRSAVCTTYLTVGMRRRMRDVSAGRPMFGGNRRPGPKTEPPCEVSLETLAGNEIRQPEPDDLPFDPALITQALAALPPPEREYVVLRFWHGMTDVDIAASRGQTKQRVNQTWQRRIKPQLRHALGDDCS